jgi:hypothetical protein
MRNLSWKVAGHRPYRLGVELRPVELVMMSEWLDYRIRKPEDAGFRAVGGLPLSSSFDSFEFEMKFFSSKDAA